MLTEDFRMQSYTYFNLSKKLGNGNAKVSN